MPKQEFPAVERVGEWGGPPGSSRALLESEGPPPLAPAPCTHGTTGLCNACDLVELMRELGFRADADLAALVRGFVEQAETTRLELIKARDSLRIIGLLADACSEHVPVEALRLALRRSVSVAPVAA